MPFSRRSIAVFDFDGTLTHRDTLLSFLKTGSKPISIICRCLTAAPWLIGFVMGISSRQLAKEALLTSFLKNSACELWENYADDFVRNTLPFLVNPKALERFYWHRDRGDNCLLVSATLGLYLRPWAEREGFKAVISSELEVTEEGILTGRLATPNCWGPEKVRRLAELLGPRENYYLYAYGDSRGDKELLEYADEGFQKVKSGWKPVSIRKCSP